MKRIRRKQEHHEILEAQQEAALFALAAASGTPAAMPESRETARPATGGETPESALEIDPDFTDQRLGTIAVDDLEATDDEDIAYFAPTDPVLTTDAHGRVEVLGGFSATSMDDVEVAPSTLDDEPGDEALAEAIRQELREDALTTSLQLTVDVREGVAYLRGAVPGLEDAENAEAVAARVPGVREVIDRLEVRSV